MAAIVGIRLHTYLGNVFNAQSLDRTSKTEKEGTANAKTTTYSYLGLSAEVLDEEVAGKLTKPFQYSPWGG
ncbi:hypothetical protein ETD86_48780 [Nonomuraea turkmeniaca]|uniref:Uncharacterized protein n=1 Tax=Nonomuraea turkmeniaca TaxID=103838 RepID=A0A5S4EXI9_9ACTN|nr:hypothetical protein [Nonomuraea turkmeniaca]TMR08211.1 hypothetical protein ETD86_48780 [Nonomuraea turkmeniaca]